MPDQDKSRKAIRGLLIDLSGVVYQGAKPIEGSVEAIGRLREARMPFRFLTNTTSRPVAEIAAQLEGFGIAAAQEDIFTPAAAARAYLTENRLQPHFLVVRELLEDFDGLPAGERPAVVLGDARDGFTFASLNVAFRRIEAGAELVALASNRMFMNGDGEPTLDVGAFVAALEYASGKEAVVLGKPARDFFHRAAAAMERDPAEVAMIGDDAEFDVIAAIRAGLKGYLVHTGKWSPESLHGLPCRPSGEFDDLLGAVSFVLDSDNP